MNRFVLAGPRLITAGDKSDSFTDWPGLLIAERLTTDHITPADSIVLAHMLDADLAAADTNAASVIAVVTEVLLAY